MAKREKHAEVEAHWASLGTLARIDAALREAGFDPNDVTTEILAPLDQVHGGGIAMTRDQAEMVGFSSAMKVLDIGCGIGGPARYLAETYGCRVWGIDLTAEWVAAGQALTAWCGLSEKVHIAQGNALDLAFDDESFDVAWCQNVTMNIADKPALLGQVHRVLKPGGKFSLAEYCRGKGGDIHYPVSWADGPEISFLVSTDEMATLLKQAGFDPIECRDLSKNLARRPQTRDDPKADEPGTELGIHIVRGTSFEHIVECRRQVARNLAEGRLAYQMILAERA